MIDWMFWLTLAGLVLVGALFIYTIVDHARVVQDRVESERSRCLYIVYRRRIRGGHPAETIALLRELEDAIEGPSRTLPDGLPPP